MRHEPSDDDRKGYLTGQLLIAMPTMRDPRFTRSVIYMCAHSAEGAMGLVVNRLIGSISFTELLEQLKIGLGGPRAAPAVHFGGPVETARGFVLHTDDYVKDDSVVVADGVALTATIEILRDIAEGRGPRHVMLALGYAGWGPGQLDSEIQENAWLHVDPDESLLFDADLDGKWERALAKLGIHPHMLSGDAGHA